MFPWLSGRPGAGMCQLWDILESEQEGGRGEVEGVKRALGEFAHHVSPVVNSGSSSPPAPG
jgi:hypothetical protein